MAESVGSGSTLDGILAQDGELKVSRISHNISVDETPNTTVVERVRAPNAGAVLHALRARTANGVSTSAAGEYTLHAYKEVDGGDTSSLLIGSEATFDDSSGWSHSVTANGGAIVDTTVAGVFSAMSGKFDGDGDYLTVADDDDWKFAGAAFSADGRIRLSDPSAGVKQVVASHRTDANNYWELGVTSADKPFFKWVQSSSTLVDMEGPDALTVGTWYWLLAERYGDHWFLWLDGSIVGSAADDTSMTDYTGSLFVAAGTASTDEFEGRLDELRISKGRARGWPSLLTTDDESSSDHTVTLRDGAFRTALQSKFGPGSLDIRREGTNGNDYCGATIPDHSDFDFGSGLFTIEFFVRLRNVTPSAGSYMVTHFTDATNFMTVFCQSTGVPKAIIRTSGVDRVALAGGSFSVDTWQHVAFERDTSDVFNLYIDGVRVANSTWSSGVYPDFTSDFIIGNFGDVIAAATGILNIDGQIDELRISNTARYGSAGFTPPSSAFTNDGNTVLLLSFDDLRTMTDSGNTGHTVYKQCHAYETGAYAWQGDGCLQVHRLNSTGDLPSGAVVPDHSDFNFGTSDFSIDSRVMLDTTSFSGGPTILNKHTGADYYYYYVTGARKFNFQVYISSTLVVELLSSTVMAIDTWYHFAVERDGNTWNLFVDGVKEATTSWSGSLSFTSDLEIGFTSYIGGPSYNWPGKIDELRVSSVARYNGVNFTPPSAAYSSDSNTKLLLHADNPEDISIPSTEFSSDNWTSLLLHMDPDIGFDLEGLTDQTDTSLSLDIESNRIFDDGDYLRIDIISDNADLTGGTGVLVSASWEPATQ
ncbi:MAG: LamG-like jellyroll fold domain-containing protein [Candidatus Thorarchaeota archaeon]|jgi:hypothetical protein